LRHRPAGSHHDGTGLHRGPDVRAKDRLGRRHRRTDFRHDRQDWPRGWAGHRKEWLGRYYSYAGLNRTGYDNPYGGNPGANIYGGYPAGGYSGGAYSSAAGASASYQTSGRGDGSGAQESSRKSTPKGLAGLFEGKGTLDWPLGLRILPPAAETEALRQEIETFLRANLKGLGSGNAPASALREARRDIARLQRLLDRHADELPVASYTVTEARRYLRRLELFAGGLE
jgi:hypothetical protein